MWGQLGVHNAVFATKFTPLNSHICTLIAAFDPPSFTVTESAPVWMKFPTNMSA